jgi:signal transduction histidine kinase
MPNRRGLVEVHGGRVAAHSDGPGRGSTFRIELRAVE